MIVKTNIDNIEIVELAKEKLSIDRKITEIIKQENLKFSYKKIIADLGEYHAKRNIEFFFEKLEFSENRVSECDLKGILKDEYSKEWQLTKVCECRSENEILAERFSTFRKCSRMQF